MKQVEYIHREGYTDAKLKSFEM